MKSWDVGFPATMCISRTGRSVPDENENSKTEPCAPPLVYTCSPSGEIARPSHASATGARKTSFHDAVSSTMIEGGLKPLFSTRRYFLSFDSTDAMGSVSRFTCAPAGFKRQPLDSKNDPSGCWPTCSLQEGCELRTAAHTTMNATLEYRFMEPHSEYRCAIGKRRPMPNALVVTFNPGAACWRLYSFRSTLQTMSFTSASGTFIRRAISAGVR